MHNKWSFYVQQQISFIKKQKHKRAQWIARAEVDTCQQGTIHRFNSSTMSRLRAFQRCEIDEPIWNSQRFDVRLLTRKIRRKQHLAAHAHIQTNTHTMWMRTVSCVASVVLYQINDVSELYNTLMDTQEQVESKTYHLGTEGKSTPFASFTSDSAVQWQHSHTKSGEVCLEVKQRALPLSFKLAKITHHIDTTITFRNNIGRKAASSYMKRRKRAFAW